MFYYQNWYCNPGYGSKLGQNHGSGSKLAQTPGSWSKLKVYEYLPVINSPAYSKSTSPGWKSHNKILLLDSGA